MSKQYQKKVNQEVEERTTKPDQPEEKKVQAVKRCKDYLGESCQDQEICKSIRRCKH